MTFSSQHAVSSQNACKKHTDEAYLYIEYFSLTIKGTHGSKYLNSGEMKSTLSEGSKLHLCLFVCFSFVCVLHDDDLMYIY